MSSTHGSDALRKFRFAAGGEGNAEEGGARRFVKLAQKAEELGYDSFMIPDHLGNQVGPIAALGALAVATDKIRLGTAVLANGFRHPAVLAKDAATIDVLSGGRLELGIGAGWMKEEFDKGGIAYESPGVRIEKLEESLQILDTLLRGQECTFEPCTVHDSSVHRTTAETDQCASRRIATDCGLPA
ncbi:LLM class flavin-dependent oxidoreductase, partial [Streptomyces sp. NPDC002130]|uniref:LLM class flavin-dependent oxidoreductase n=1 Tax=Streptomyces sp. NPDC002130 TaxID=3155568 RepID=UPI00331D0EE8